MAFHPNVPRTFPGRNPGTKGYSRWLQILVLLCGFLKWNLFRQKLLQGWPTKAEQADDKEKDEENYLWYVEQACHAIAGWLLDRMLGINARGFKTCPTQHQSVRLITGQDKWYKFEGTNVHRKWWIFDVNGLILGSSLNAMHNMQPLPPFDIVRRFPVSFGGWHLIWLIFTRVKLSQKKLLMLLFAGDIKLQIVKSGTAISLLSCTWSFQPQRWRQHEPFSPPYKVYEV